MFIVIVGSGQIGKSLAGQLVSAGHEVGVIEMDPARCEALEDELGSVVILGDGTEVGVQAKAGVSRADVFIATTRSDENNILSCQIARHRFNAPRTISVVNLPEHTRLFGLLGIEAAINVTELVVNQIQEHLSIDGIVHLMAMPGNNGRTLVSIRIPRESRMAGRPISEIDLPDGALISLVIGRDGTTSVPTQETLVQAEDEILAVADAKFHEELVDLFTQQFAEAG